MDPMLLLEQIYFNFKYLRMAQIGGEQSVSMKPMYPTNIYLFIWKLFPIFWYCHMLEPHSRTIAEPHDWLAFVLTQGLYTFNRIPGLILPESQMQTHGFKDTGFLTGVFLLQRESNGGPPLHPEETARPRGGRMMEDTGDKPRDRTLTAPRDSGAF